MMISGFITRDSTGIFCLFTEDPYRDGGVWWSEHGKFSVISKHEVPEELLTMTFEDEPVRYTMEVKILKALPSHEN